MLNQARTDSHGHHWQDGACLGCGVTPWDTEASEDCPTPAPHTRLTRQERLEAWADHGVDTHGEARCER